MRVKIKWNLLMQYICLHKLPSKGTQIQVNILCTVHTMFTHIYCLLMKHCKMYIKKEKLLYRLKFRQGAAAPYLNTSECSGYWLTVIYCSCLHSTGSMCTFPLVHSEAKAVANLSQNFLLILNVWKIYNPTETRNLLWLNVLAHIVLSLAESPEMCYKVTTDISND